MRSNAGMANRQNFGLAVEWWICEIVMFSLALKMGFSMDLHEPGLVEHQFDFSDAFIGNNFEHVNVFALATCYWLTHC